MKTVFWFTFVSHEDLANYDVEVHEHEPCASVYCSLVELPRVPKYLALKGLDWETCTVRFKSGRLRRHFNNVDRLPQIIDKLRKMGHIH